jgi:hypothetical protein
MWAQSVIQPRGMVSLNLSDTQPTFPEQNHEFHHRKKTMSSTGYHQQQLSTTNVCLLASTERGLISVKQVSVHTTSTLLIPQTPPPLKDAYIATVLDWGWAL